MSSTDEEARAALWREQRAQRIAYQRDVWLAMRAPSGPRDAVLAAWQPVLAWQAERGVVIDPEEDP